MKKILSILAGLVLVVSSLVAVPLFAYRHPMCSTQEEVLTWIQENIWYEAEPEGLPYDDWQTPEETLLKRSGDCEDFTILAMYLLDLIGVKSEMGLVLLDPDDEKGGCDECGRIGDGDLGGHAMLFIGNQAYEPQSGRIVKYEYKLLYRMTYLEVMYRAYSY